MRALRLAAGLLAVAAIASWNAVVTRTVGGGDRPSRVEDGSTADPEVIEHERDWYDYLRGFHAHHDDVAGDHPEHGSFWEGLDLWLVTRCLRGYTLGDQTYVCSNAPRVLRVHQTGHAPSFGRQFEPLGTERRPDRGLEDEPLRTLDVMLPGDVPHTLFRVRDPRGLGETYDEWVRSGRLVRR